MFLPMVKYDFGLGKIDCLGEIVRYELSNLHFNAITERRAVFDTEIVYITDLGVYHNR